MLAAIKHWIHFLRNPWAIAGGVVLGVIVGIFSHAAAEVLGPWGYLYIRFLEMCIIPIVISAVVSSIGKLLKSEEAAHYLKKLILIIVLGLFIASALGIALSLIGRPGEGLSLHSEIKLGRIVTKYEQNQHFEVVPEKIITLYKEEKKDKKILFSFLTQIVPKNIFGALSRGENIQVLFFSIIFGIALGWIPNEYSNPILNLFSGVFIAIEKIIHFALYLLPLALVCLLAKQVAETGAAILVILVKYIILYFSILIVLFCVNLWIIAVKLKIPYFKSLKALKEAILIGLGSANVYIAMPSALKSLHSELHLERNTVNLVLPIGISIFAFGSTFFYAFNTLFMVQLFDISLNFQSYFIILFGAILTSMSTVGAPVLIKLTMLSIMFTPLGIPLAPAIAILLAIKPITESFEEVWDLHCNCVLTALVAKKISESSTSPIETTVRVPK